jgi:uncharacterized protein (TIGR02266 family)
VESPPQESPARRVFIDRQPRVELVLRVDYESLGQLRSDYLTNLSTGGLFLRSETCLPKGTQMNLQLSFPSLLKPVNVKVEVRWTSEGKGAMSGMGVAFVDLDPDARAAIEKLVGEAPKAGEAAAPSPAAGATGASGTSGGMRVVLLEPNKILHDIYKATIRKFADEIGSHRKLELLAAESADQCLQATKNSCNLAIIDCDQSHYVPEKLVKEMQGVAPQLPIVLLSEHPAKLMGLGNQVMVLKKPVAMRALFKTLTILIGK